MDASNRARMAWSFWRRFRKSLHPHTDEDIDIVFSIDANQEGGRRLTVGNLVDLGIASRNTVLRRLNFLLRCRMIATYSATDDRRYRELALTGKGKALVTRVTGKLNQLRRSISARAGR